MSILLVLGDIDAPIYQPVVDKLERASGQKVDVRTVSSDPEGREFEDLEKVDEALGAPSPNLPLGAVVSLHDAEGLTMWPMTVLDAQFRDLPVFGVSVDGQLSPDNPEQIRTRIARSLGGRTPDM